MTAPIVLLTDFGLGDAYVGQLKGAILCRNPAARLVDLTHDVPPQDIRRAAFLLATSPTYFPAGSVFLTVVDPGVGTDRRPVAIYAADWAFVGPDNGVLAWALRFMHRDGLVGLRAEAGRLVLGEGCRAVELTESRFWRPEVSSTFHGRDLFGPVASELSLGRELGELGRSLASVVDLPWPEVRREGDGDVLGEVVTIDRYGNLVTSLRAEDLPTRPRFEVARYRIAGLSRHFQSGDPLVALVGSSGFVEIAAPNGSAAAVLCAGPELPIRVRAE